jgi:cobalamin-dependent methionine synthase I
VTKDNGKHWLTENKGEMAENLKDVCAHTHLHKQETEREKRKSRECSPKKAGTHQVSNLDISFETSYIDQTMLMHDKTVFFQTP